MNWMQTNSGKRFYPLNPKVEDVDINDIATGLAKICRFSGQVQGDPYSVAQHSVLVCDRVTYGAKLYALLHDAAEAYLGDWAAPLKRDLRETYGNIFDDIEHNVMVVILNKFNVTVTDSIKAEVKNADKLVTAIEKRDLMLPDPDWKTEVCQYTLINPWSWKMSKHLFLDYFNALNIAKK